MDPIRWSTIHEIFAPFEGSCLYAIRGDAFFHLAQAESSPVKFALKNFFYPAIVRWRAARQQSILPPAPQTPARFLFICDYPAEPGFGTLRPVLQRLGHESAFVGTGAVMQARVAELKQLGPELVNLDHEAVAARKGRWGEFKQRAERDYQLLLKNSPSSYRELFVASRRVLKTLLRRAYSYQEAYEWLLAERKSLAAVITHNDFTTSSYLACIAARNAGIKSFTLQHGLPTQEYFPTSAEYYIVWGQRFYGYMRSHPGLRSKLLVAGAPRFDSLFQVRRSPAAMLRGQEESHSRTIGRWDIVFLSQSHSPLFSDAEHRSILSVLRPLLADHRFNVVVRLHPQENKRRFRQLSGCDHVTIAPRDLSLLETLAGADAVISCNSTAMLEAMALQIPVVQIVPPQLDNRLGVIKACCVATNGEELLQCLDELRKDRSHTFHRKQNALLSEYFSHSSATDAVCLAIEEELACGLCTVEAEAR